MGIKTSANGRTITLDVGKKTDDPVAEVLAALSGQQVKYGSRLFLDLTGLKPGRIGGSEGIDRLLHGLPTGRGITYIVGLPEQLVSEAERLARAYESSLLYDNRPTYLIGNKDTAIRLANQ